jgi:hypothetical protein
VNEPHDPIEAELLALRPRQPSSALRRGIGRKLARPLRIRLWATASAGGLAAAAVLVAVLVRPERETDLANKQVTRPPQMERLLDDDSLPTVLVYSQAIARSPEEIDDLLSKHSALGQQPSINQTSAPTVLALRLNPWRGEL